MRAPDLQRRIDAQIARQADRKLGRELRHEAFYRLFREHTDMNAEQFESWLELLETEEAEPPVLNLSAGAAALVMMDVRDSHKRRVNDA